MGQVTPGLLVFEALLKTDPGASFWRQIEYFLFLSCEAQWKRGCIEDFGVLTKHNQNFAEQIVLVIKILKPVSVSITVSICYADCFQCSLR